MSNRRFEMFQYRQVIHRMRMGESDRTIAQSKADGSDKMRQVRAIAGQQGWLDKELPLPDDEDSGNGFDERSNMMTIPPISL